MQNKINAAEFYDYKQWYCALCSNVFFLPLSVNYDEPRVKLSIISVRPKQFCPHVVM